MTISIIGFTKVILTAGLRGYPHNVLQISGGVSEVRTDSVELFLTVNLLL